MRGKSGVSSCGQVRLISCPDAILSEAWPQAPGAANRANIGRQVDAPLRRIHEIEAAIVSGQACTMADAAVQLRFR